MSRLTVKEYHVQAPVTLRFALIADLHNQKGLEVAKCVQAQSPDAVLIAGDLFETPPRKKRVRCEEAVALINALSPLPIFYARGNHDWGLPPAMESVFTKVQANLLFDSYTSFRGISIGGLSSAHYLPSRVPNTAFLDSFSSMEGFKILLCHHPEYYPTYIKKTSINLTLSGHAHGGQWTLFGRGVFAPGQGLFPRYYAGMHEGRLLISRGLKDMPHIPRIGNPREVVIISLSPHL